MIQLEETSPKESMSITFRAKEGIITSNPTDLAVTAEGLANPDASENYDDITTALEKKYCGRAQI